MDAMCGHCDGSRDPSLDVERLLVDQLFCEQNNEHEAPKWIKGLGERPRAPRHLVEEATRAARDLLCPNMFLALRARIGADYMIAIADIARLHGLDDLHYYAIAGPWAAVVRGDRRAAKWLDLVAVGVDPAEALEALDVVGI